MQPASRIAGVSVPIDQVKPNPRNIRRSGPGDLDDFAASVRAHGILQPLIVEDVAGDYIVIAGHRRLAAARRAGLTHVPCLIRDGAAQSRVTAMMLIENVQRADLHPIDEANAYQQLLNDGWTRGQIAAATGVRMSRIAARLDLLHLPAQVKAMVRAGTLPLGQAGELARQVKATRTGATNVRPERCKPHLVGSHPLAEKARLACDLAGHSTNGRIGTVACGACWENTIRHDARMGGS